MKNTLLALVLTVATAFAAQAQDYYPPTTQEPTTSEFKPVAGDRSVEIGSNLYFDNYYNSTVTLQFRKFTSDTHAFRIGAGAYISNTNDDNGITDTFGYLKIAPGFERHFAGTSRLSPYIGAELPVSVSYARYENNNQVTKGGGYNGHNRAFKGVGLVALAGVDFYVVKNFYIGLEFGAGITYMHFNDTKIDYKEPDQADTTLKGGQRISFSTLSNSGLRVGFVF